MPLPDKIIDPIQLLFDSLKQLEFFNEQKKTESYNILKSIFFTVTPDPSVNARIIIQQLLKNYLIELTSLKGAAIYELEYKAQLTKRTIEEKMQEDYLKIYPFFDFIFFWQKGIPLCHDPKNKIALLFIICDLIKTISCISINLMNEHYQKKDILERAISEMINKKINDMLPSLRVKATEVNQEAKNKYKEMHQKLNNMRGQTLTY